MQLDGCHTRMLRMVYNISWKDHIRNDILYGKLPAISLKIKERRMRMSGHCYRYTEEIASKLILRKPQDGHTRRGRYRISYIDKLLADNK